MNSYTIKILVFFLSLFILITISSQIYLAFQDNYKTQTAIAYTADEKIDFQGIYIRNETVIDYSGTGVINYPYPDGSKIAKGSVVAYVYNNESDITTNENIAKLTKELDMLKKVQNPGTTTVAQPEFLSSLIEEKYQEIASSIKKNDLDALSTQRDELLTLMNIMQIVIEKADNYNDRIAYLESEISTLTAGQALPVQTITVVDPGYFVSYTDGYEGQLSCDNIDSINSELIKNIINDSESEVDNKLSIGKIIDGYSWKMVGIIDNSKNKFLKGLSVKLSISSSMEQVNAIIEDVKETDNPKESIIIISCDELTHDLVQRRVERVSMKLNAYDGIKVPRTAIRFNNGEKGVYVKLGQQLIFKKIDVIFEGDTYVISSNSSKTGYLLLYDEIVVDGVNAKEVSTNVSTETSVVTDTPVTEAKSSAVSSTEGIIVGNSQTQNTTTSVSVTSVIDTNSRGETEYE